LQLVGKHHPSKHQIGVSEMKKLEELMWDINYRVELLGEEIRDARNFMNDAESKEDKLAEKHEVDLLEREKEILTKMLERLAFVRVEIL
jgi:transcription elongation GreA/GreB family factor